MSKKEEFLRRILETFKIEAEENINSLYSDLIKLEKETDDSNKKELIEVIYRSVHSLKGASRAVNLNDIETVCHAFEDVMSAVRDGNIDINTDIFDIFHKTVDIISELLKTNGKEIDTQLSERISTQMKILSDIESGKYLEKHCDNEIENIYKEDITDSVENKNFIKEVVPVDNNEIILKEESSIKQDSVIERREIEDTTIRVSNRKLDKLLFKAEEMLEIKLSALERKDNLRHIVDKINSWDKEYEGNISTIQSLNSFFENKEDNIREREDIATIIRFFDQTRTTIKEVRTAVNSLLKVSEQDGYYTGVKIDNLLNDVKDVITIPFSILLDMFPKMVRDIAKDLGKEVDFIIAGEELEIDRRVLEKIKDPLIHILRNAIDYGVESYENRIKKGKSLKGKICIKVNRLESNKVQILIEDDGAGIDIGKIKYLYGKNEDISESELEKISTKDLLNYIFKSGVSTSDIVTDISGRGLGLSIVWDNIEQLGGTVDVESKKDEYTRFKINLPLSLVTYRGVILGLSGNEYIVPTSKVGKVLRLENDKIKKVENKDTFSYNGEIIPIVNLSEILSLAGNRKEELDYLNVIILTQNGKSIGFIVESVIGEQEVLVKKFNKQLSRVKYVSGATILGSGKVVPILNISDIFKSSLSSSNSFVGSGSSQDNSKEKKKSILIVEDSVTSRMLLKNILEASGYMVVTAIDGIDGYTKLKEGSFDAVVSDIEMPRLNGFELTKKIRNDDTVKSLPVILVTSLSKREHREKGIDVGANAYIVKSSFDHSNLLEILDRLI